MNKESEPSDVITEGSGIPPKYRPNLEVIRSYQEVDDDLLSFENCAYSVLIPGTPIHEKVIDSAFGVIRKIFRG